MFFFHLMPELNGLAWTSVSFLNSFFFIICLCKKVRVLVIVFGTLVFFQCIPWVLDIFGLAWSLLLVRFEFWHETYGGKIKCCDSYINKPSRKKLYF